MLNDDQAKEQLKSFQIEQWDESRLGLLKRKNARLAKAGRWLVTREDEEPAPTKQEKSDSEKALELGKQLSSWTREERRELYSAAFPKMVDALDCAWEACALRSVGAAWENRPFRAPHNPDKLAAIRGAMIADFFEELKGYDPDPAWFAAWAPHLGSYGLSRETERVLAGAIDAGGKQAEEVIEVLKASAKGEHEIGRMGSHVIEAFLCSSRPEAWEFIEKMLVAAQREEGLRQQIVEAVDSGHPEAFKRMVRLILDENLVRFSSIVRAVDAWFGLAWDAVSTKTVAGVLERALAFLEEPGAREAAYKGKKAEDVYLALWAAAFEDLDAANDRARQILDHKSAEHRYAALHLIAYTGSSRALLKELPRCLRDPDMRVAARAVTACNEDRDADAVGPLPEVFDALEDLMKRIPKKQVAIKPIIWPWTPKALYAKDVAYAMKDSVAEDQVERLVPYFDRIESYQRWGVVRVLGGLAENSWNEKGPRKLGPLAPTIRKVVLDALGDASRDVREAAFEVLAVRETEPGETARIEELLSRKSSDLRSKGVARLARLPDHDLLAACERLVRSRDRMQRAAGIELLRTMAAGGRSVSGVKSLAGVLRKELQKKLDERELEDLGVVTGDVAPRPTLKDCLGLLDESKRTRVKPARALGVPTMTAAGLATVYEIDRLVRENKEKEYVSDKDYEKGKTYPLGDDSPWSFPSPDVKKTIDDDRARLPLAELWESWYAARSRELRDPDGLEIARAMVAAECNLNAFKKVKWPAGLRERVVPAKHADTPEFREMVKHILGWLFRLHPPKGWADWALDAAEDAVARKHFEPTLEAVLAERQGKAEGDPAIVRPFRFWIKQLENGRNELGARWEPEHAARLWRVYCQQDLVNPATFSDDDDDDFEDSPEDERISKLEEQGKLTWDEYHDLTEHDTERPAVGHVVPAMAAGAATEADLIHMVLWSHTDDPAKSHSDVDVITTPARERNWRTPPDFDRMTSRIVRRVLEIELERGEAPTAATRAALDLTNSGGMDVVIPFTARMGEAKFARGYRYNQFDKGTVFTSVIKATKPGSGETPAAFASAARKAGISEERLIELAFVAPRWSRHVEAALAWEGFDEAVWWILAHTKDSAAQMQETADEEYKDPTLARLSELTPVPHDALRDGAVDVAWFHRLNETLGKARWELVHAAAKYACSGAAHKRAQLFADAMLAKVTEAELLKRVKDKAHQDAVRALGLVPLKKGKEGDAQVLKRFEAMQEMRRTSRKRGGSLLQASERRAVEIGMENLARTAGYPDPMRLQWAMEKRQLGELAKGPVRAKAGGVEVALSIDDDGAPIVSTTKAGKELKTLPPAAKKDKKIAELLEQSKELRKQASRVRQTLEQAMCRGDEFSGAELVSLMEHPVLRPMLVRLVLVGQSGAGAPLMGYPDKGGKVLRDHAGELEPLKASDRVRVAHPHDLLKAKTWDKWQRECFAAERVQPFKQVFRELYVLAPSEKSAKATTRFSGHQVQPRQGLALLGSRQWVTRPEENGVQKTFHAERITASLSFEEYFFTPDDVEGLTVGNVAFATSGKGDEIDLAKVPPRLFSEALRDVDLVVSVAHRGGVDPEASESTVQMRASLLRETCRLLGLSNVAIQDSRATIKGTLSEYSLHLGSGTIHMLPGGAVWIAPIHSQHRGRIFLPFADDDPKTAEVITKAITLARDSEIKDPGIIEQIRRR